MKARWAATMLAVALIVPISAFAFDRPDEAKQYEPEEEISCPQCSSLSPSSVVGIQTPILTKNRQYRIEITGEWKPSSASGHLADAAWETTDSWSTQTQAADPTQRLGMVVGYLGNLAENPNAFYKSDHKYSVDIAGRGVTENIRVNDPVGYTDNGVVSANPLTIRIFAVKKVHYVMTLSRQVALVIDHVPNQTFDTSPYSQTIGPIDRQTVSVNQSLPDVPAIGTITVAYSGGGSCADPSPQFRELKLTVVLFTANGSPDVDGDGDPSKLTVFNGPLGSGPSCIKIGPGIGIPPISVTQQIGPIITPDVQRSVDVPPGCDPSPCSFSVPPKTTIESEMVWPCNKTGPISTVPGGPLALALVPCNAEGDVAILAEGSTIETTIGWHADTEKLWYTVLNDENFPIEEEPGQWQAVMPYGPSDSQWFVSELAARRLTLDFQVSIYGPNRSGIFQTTVFSVPGLGQILEAMFASTVDGQ